jgi:VIT1/CCC1 family predicted Fe2+/Mn2+ transporter
MPFKNPSNGYIEDYSSFGAFFLTLLFGPIYLAVKGVWTHVVASVFLALLTAGISWLIYPFFAPSIIRKSYLRKGWIEV